MSANIQNLYVQQYKGNIQLLLQQRGSRLRGSVTESSDYVGEQAAPVDQIGAVEAQAVTGRYETIQAQDYPTDRRWVFPRDYDHAQFVDTFDKLRLLTDPTSFLAINAANGMGRRIDDTIINAFFGTAQTGKTGATAVTFPSSQQLSASVGASGATGLNVQKLKQGLEILMANEVDMDNDPIFCAITAKQNTNLLNELQVIDADFRALGADVQKGRIMSFMGINFLHSERLPLNGSNQRRIPLYAKSGMHLAIWGGATRADISQRKDLKGFPYQVYLWMTLDATRLEEKKIVEIPCAES